MDQHTAVDTQDGVIGYDVFDSQPDGSEAPAKMESGRLFSPRCVCTESHVHYIIECYGEVCER